MKFLKRFKFGAFRFQGNYGIGIGFSKRSIGVEFIFWHLSVTYYNDEERAKYERIKAIMDDLKTMDWELPDDLQ
jgi:hypothetical protein